MFLNSRSFGTVADRQHHFDNIESVRQDVTHNPQKLAKRRSEKLQIFKTSSWRTLREDLKYYSYKIQFVQTIGQTDYEKRV